MDLGDWCRVFLIEVVKENKQALAYKKDLEEHSGYKDTKKKKWWMGEEHIWRDFGELP